MIYHGFILGRVPHSREKVLEKASRVAVLMYCTEPTMSTFGENVLINDIDQHRHRLPVIKR